MTHIVGIGGVFLKAKDPEKLRAWYKDTLGVKVDEYGAMFPNPKDGEGYQVWGVFKADTDYFAPSEKEFMINFRVIDLDGLLAKLALKGVDQIKPMEEHEYGRFAWIMDPEGTKIELWELPH